MIEGCLCISMTIHCSPSRGSRALATVLYRARSLSLGQAARFSGLNIAEFIQHVSRLGIPVVGGTSDTVREDAEAIVRWRSGSSQSTRAR